MQQTKTNKLRRYLNGFLWILLLQFLLMNISAAIYAYHFTHFYEGRPPETASQNAFQKTWKLFTGPKFYKITSWAEPSFPYQPISLKTTDGILLDAWYSFNDSAKGCVIFFHGITVNKSYLIDEASMIRNYGYSVLLVDFRGHGKSTGNTS